MIPRLLPCLVAAAMLAFAFPLRAAGPPPSPTLFEKKAPWVVSSEVIEKYEKRNKDSIFREANVQPWPLIWSWESGWMAPQSPMPREVWWRWFSSRR
jgi:hypothetical protein